MRIIKRLLNTPIKLLPGVVILQLLLISCYDKNAFNVQETVFYSPEYSIPIGQLDVPLEDVINELGYDLTEIPDTTGLPDTIPIFIYDGKVYENPVLLHYVTVESLDLSSVSANQAYVVTMMLRSNIVNEVPGELDITVQFLDEQQSFVGNLCRDCQFTIPPAQTDEEGNLIEPGVLLKHDIFFTEEEVELIDVIRYARIIALLDVKNLKGEAVKYFPGQKFAIQMGLRAKFNIPLHEM